MIDLLKQVKIVVYYVRDERVNWVKDQIKNLNLTIEFEFVRGFTKDDSEGYQKNKHSNPKYAEAETDGQIACLRTFANILYKFSQDSGDKKYVITMEDDACLLKDGFEEKLTQAILKYKKYRKEIDYVCLGYGPFDIERLKSRNTGHDDGFYWGFWNGRKTIEDFDNLYGGQMLLFDKIAAKQISDVFHQNNTDEIRNKIKERIDFGLIFSLKVDVLLGDHVLPLVFRQSAQYPPLCIEGDFFTSMEQGFNNFDTRNWSKYLEMSNYYINQKSDKRKILLTDIMFPNKFSTWRNNEIISFIEEFDTDILIFKIDSYADTQFDFDWDFHNQSGLLNGYNILISNPKYNHLNKYNQRIDGTKFNYKFLASYLITKSSDFDINKYDAVYHIFLNTFNVFDQHFKFDYSKQFIHLYPGGGYTDLSKIDNLEPKINIISTHHRTTKKLKEIGHKNFLIAYFGTLMKSDESFFEKPEITDKTINICFSTMGSAVNKGDDIYHQLINFYQLFPEKKIKFWAVGNFEKRDGVEIVEPMDYLSLAKFYRKNIDVYINPETGNSFNGWPLGLESVINGSVLVTSDPNNDHDSYFKEESGIFVFKDFRELVKIIDHLYENLSEIRSYSKLTQKNLKNYLTYENQQSIIFNYIKSRLV